MITFCQDDLSVYQTLMYIYLNYVLHISASVFIRFTDCATKKNFFVPDIPGQN